MEPQAFRPERGGKESHTQALPFKESSPKLLVISVYIPSARSSQTQLQGRLRNVCILGGHVPSQKEGFLLAKKKEGTIVSQLLVYQVFVCLFFNKGPTIPPKLLGTGILLGWVGPRDLFLFRKRLETMIPSLFLFFPFLQILCLRFCVLFNKLTFNFDHIPLAGC